MNQPLSHQKSLLQHHPSLAPPHPTAATPFPLVSLPIRFLSKLGSKFQLGLVLVANIHIISRPKFFGRTRAQAGVLLITRSPLKDQLPAGYLHIASPHSGEVWLSMPLANLIEYVVFDESDESHLGLMLSGDHLTQTPWLIKFDYPLQLEQTVQFLQQFLPVEMGEGLWTRSTKTTEQQQQPLQQQPTVLRMSLYTFNRRHARHLLKRPKEARWSLSVDPRTALPLLSGELPSFLEGISGDCRILFQLLDDKLLHWFSKVIHVGLSQRDDRMLNTTATTTTSIRVMWLTPTCLYLALPTGITENGVGITRCVLYQRLAHLSLLSNRTLALVLTSDPGQPTQPNLVLQFDSPKDAQTCLSIIQQCFSFRTGQRLTEITGEMERIMSAEKILPELVSLRTQQELKEMLQRPTML